MKVPKFIPTNSLREHSFFGFSLFTDNFVIRELTMLLSSDWFDKAEFGIKLLKSVLDCKVDILYALRPWNFCKNSLSCASSEKSPIETSLKAYSACFNSTLLKSAIAWSPAACFWFSSFIAKMNSINESYVGFGR